MDNNIKLQDINKLNDQISVMKEALTNELNTVNYYYWPLISKSKKKLDNLKWYFTLACCFLASVIILLLLHEVTNEYWIGASLGLSISILAAVTFFLVKHVKKNKILNNEWNKALEKSKEIQKELNEKIEDAKEMMIRYFKNEKDSIHEEIGNSYDDILEYYNGKLEN